MSRPKLLLVTPPYHCGVVEVAGRWLPLHLLYIGAAARRAGVDVVLWDAMSRFDGWREIREVLSRVEPDYVATSSITATVPAVLLLSRLAKEVVPSATVMVGGVHPTFMPEEILESAGGSIDYVIRGEGEETIRELFECLRRGGDPRSVKGLAFADPTTGAIVRTPPRPLRTDLDEIEPDFGLADWSIYKYFVIPGSRLGAVSTSRGCNHGCTFCSQQKFWTRLWRGRRPERVVEEIATLHRLYGVDVILISDEYPTCDAARWEEILDRLIARRLPVHLLMETRAEDIVRDERILPKYRQAGVLHVYVGLEATDQDTLDLIGKELTVDEGKTALDLIRSHGMLSETSFVLGFPHETRESIDRTLELAKRANPDMAHFLCITPWPYGDLWPEMRDRVRVFDYAKYNLIEPVVEPHALSLEDLDRAIIGCYRDFYMGKVLDFSAFPDELRRSYMKSSMKLIMRSSFLAEKVKRLGVSFAHPAWVSL